MGVSWRAKVRSWERREVKVRVDGSTEADWLSWVAERKEG